MNCQQCGATLSTKNVTSLNDVVKNEHAKRALEVALVRDHSIGFVGGEEATQLAQWGADHGLTSFSTTRCPCGYYGDYVRECTCSVKTVITWQSSNNYRQTMNAELVIETFRPTPDQILRWRERQGEEDDRVLSRVEQVVIRLPLPNPPEPLEPYSQSLLRAAISQLALTTLQVDSVISISQSIAWLAGSAAIRVAHLAEAIQYQPRRIF